MIRTLAAACLALAAGAGAAEAQDPARYIDARAAYSAQISPSGKEVALIRRTDDVEQILIVDLAAKQSRAIQSVKRSSKFELDWLRGKGGDRLVVGATVELVQEGRAATGQMLKQADQTFRISRVFAIGSDGRNSVQMFQGQLGQLWGNLGSTQLLDELPAEPGYVMISAFENSGFGAWKADIMTGKVQQVANGGLQTIDYTTDGTGYPVMRIDATANTQRIFRRASGAQEWLPAGEIRQSLAHDTPDFAIVGPGPANNQVYVLARHNSDRSGLFLYDSSTGAFGEPLAPAGEADAAAPWIDPKSRALLATVRLVNMSDDATRWLLSVDMPTEGTSYYVFDRTRVQMDPITQLFPGLAGERLSPTQVVSYAARDGTMLWAYVTAKPGATGPQPMVVMPHGGPEARDYYGYDPLVQFLAQQGYLVVQPNFRGSNGFGEEFAKAGNGQWGKRMQDDVTDAAKHMIASGAADGAKVCIVGASYGGYAALAGVSLTPDLYKCAVSIAGVSDLVEMLKIERRDNGGESNGYYYWRYSIGDPDKDRAALEAVSPRKLARSIVAPVLLIHGEDDETVPILQSIMMNDALRDAKRQVKLIRLPKSDHYWDNWKSKERLTVLQEVAAFLKQHLN